MGLFEVYSLLDLEPVKAKGAYLWDKNGDKYLDFYGNHGMSSINFHRSQPSGICGENDSPAESDRFLFECGEESFTG